MKHLECDCSILRQAVESFSPRVPTLRISSVAVGLRAEQGPARGTAVVMAHNARQLTALIAAVLLSLCASTALSSSAVRGGSKELRT